MSYLARVMVLAGEGINCENETIQAFLKAGAIVEKVFIQDWIKNPKKIHSFDILAFPGGFSYGDEIHSGQILALEIKYSLAEDFDQFIKNGGLVIGICNGFQVLMKLDVFKNEDVSESISLYHNKSGQFINRWVKCQVPVSRCIWTKNLSELSLPVRHGEGRIIFSGDQNNQESIFHFLKSNSQVALYYTEDINGSYQKIAGLTDSTGQVFGLMPHPEACLDISLYPEEYIQEITLPLQIFKNAINHIQENKQ